MSLLGHIRRISVDCLRASVVQLVFSRTRNEVIGLAEGIVESAKSAGCGLTSAEKATIDRHLGEAKTVNTALADEARSKGIMAGLDAMAGGISVAAASQSLTANGRRLSFGKSMAAAVAPKILGSPDGSTKAMAPSGAAVVGLDFDENPVTLVRVATSLLNILPVILHDWPRFQFLRQGMTSRTNNAAVVADGAVKPVSPLGVDMIDNMLDVVAHLSELVPRYWLTDNAALHRFISDELQFGLALAIEAMVVADFNLTTGIQT